MNRGEFSRFACMNGRHPEGTLCQPLCRRIPRELPPDKSVRPMLTLRFLRENLDSIMRNSLAFLHSFFLTIFRELFWFQFPFNFLRNFLGKFCEILYKNSKTTFVVHYIYHVFKFFRSLSFLKFLQF